MEEKCGSTSARAERHDEIPVERGSSRKTLQKTISAEKRPETSGKDATTEDVQIARGASSPSET